MAGRARSRRIDKKNRAAMKWITGFLVIMLLVLGFLSYRLYNQKNELLQRKAVYEQQLEDEKKRTEDIKDYANSINTKEFIEQTAKEKLGLLYANEILFKKSK